MKKLSLNIKKIALSLLVVGLAVGFSAFTDTQKIAEGDLYGNNGAIYTLREDPYSPSLCASGTNRCAYQETEEGEGIVTPNFDAAQAELWVTAGFLVRVGSTGTYNGD